MQTESTEFINLEEGKHFHKSEKYFFSHIYKKNTLTAYSSVVRHNIFMKYLMDIECNFS